MDGSVIGYVVSVVTQRRGEEWHQPDGGDAEIFKIIQPLSQAAEIADAVAIAVVHGPHVHLVDDGVLVPERSCKRCQNLLLQAHSSLFLEWRVSQFTTNAMCLAKSIRGSSFLLFGSFGDATAEVQHSTTSGTESFGAAGGVSEIGFDDFPSQKRMLEQLGDLIALANDVGLGAEVFHEDDDFTAIAGVDDSGVAQKALLGHAGAGLHDAAGRRRELDGDSGVNSGGAVGRQGDVFGGVEVIADVFSGMCYCWQHCIGRELFHFEHARSFCQMTTNSQSSARVPFFDEDAVRRVLRYEDLIPAMERALADFSTGKVLQPVRRVLPVAEHRGFFGVMPAVYGDTMGAKLVTLYPGNAGTTLPTQQGIIVLLR